MLTISKSQMERLDESRRAEFKQQMARHLRANLPDESTKYTDEQLAHAIDNGITIAAHSGIHKERNVAIFIDVMCWLSDKPGCKENLPLINEILGDPAIVEEDDRIDILLGYIRHEAVVR